MEKKAKIRIRGYFADLTSWFKLPKRRREWIDQGNPNFDAGDPVADLAKRLHPGLISAVITEVKQETPSSRTYTLKPEAPHILPLHYAGQYMSVKFEIDGKALTRPFAISSPPMTAYRDNLIQITLRKKADGYVSAYVWDHWQAGSRLRFEAPLGQLFYSAIRDAAHVVGIAGGSGITIFRSIIGDMRESHRPERLTLLYGSRQAEDIIFKDELDEWAARSNGRVKIHHILSEADKGWTGERGFITRDLIRKLVPDYGSAGFYVSGPPALYDFIGPELDALKIRPTRRRIECYGESGPIERHRDFPRDQENRTYAMKVLFGRDEQEVPAKSTETVAVALERAGLAVDTQCRSGECGWCRSKLVAGKVWQRPESDGVRERDKDAAYFHPCSAYPLEDLTVRVFTRL